MLSSSKRLGMLGIRDRVFAKSLQSIMTAFVPVSITISAAAIEDPRIYVVKVYGASAPGSGVVVKSDKKNSVILTAGHVVSDTNTEDRPYILTHDRKIYSISQISIHSTLDLAELTVLESLQPAPISSNFHNGGDIILVGFPQASTKSLVLKGSSQPQSLVSDIRPGGYGLVHNAKSSTGFSGGGIFDHSGSLVGIHGQADTSLLQSGRLVKTGFALAIPLSFWLPSITAASATVTDAQRNNDYLAEVSYLRSVMKYEEAINKVSKLMLTRPQDGPLLLLRATLYIDMKQPLLALADLVSAETLMPSSPAVHANKGTAYFLQDNLELSLNSYEQAIKLDPNISDIYINKSKVLFKLRRPLEALEALNAAIKSNKQNAHIYIERARAHYELGQYRQAKDDLDIYIRSYPDDAMALSLMGSISGKLGNTKESYNYFSQAADLKPESSVDALNKAVALAELGDRDTAIKEIRTILSVRPMFLPAMANLSELLFLKGEKSESCQLAHEATEMGFDWVESEWDSVFLSSCMYIKSKTSK